jgi:hypothetical protein
MTTTEMDSLRTFYVKEQRDDGCYMFVVCLMPVVTDNVTVSARVFWLKQFLDFGSRRMMT